MKVFYHNCGLGYGRNKGIIEFKTIDTGYTQAICRQCGKDVTHRIVIDESLLGILPKGD